MPRHPYGSKQNSSTRPLSGLDPMVPHIQPKLFFGFDAKKIAEPEKAFLDLVYMKMRRGTFQMSETFYLDLLNRRRLQLFAKKFPMCVNNALSFKHGE